MNQPRTPMEKQRGAVLLVALIMLVLITLMATAGMRSSALEARVTTNTLTSQALFNAAEAGLREGERKILTSPAALPQCPETPTGSAPQTVCFRGQATDYGYEFKNANAYSGGDGPTDMSATVQWYIREIKLGDAAANTGDQTSSKPDTRYYEVTSQARERNATSNEQCSVVAVCLRSVVVRTFTK